MSERLKSIGSTMLGCLVALAFLAVPIVFVKGAVWMGEHVIQWLINIAVLAFILNILLVLPLAAFRRTRPWAGIVLYCSSYLFGLATWFLGLLLTYSLWGIVPTIIGLLFLGVGVVVMGILATLFKGMWPELMWLVIYLVVTVAFRMVGLTFASTGKDATQFEAQNAPRSGQDA